MNEKQFLKDLLEAYSPSSDEKKAQAVVRAYMCENGIKETYQDKIGNVGFSLGSGPIKILLSGHIDEIAMIVNGIDDDGLLIPSQYAGVDRKVLPGSKVIVLDDLGSPRKGIIYKHPLHLEKSDGIHDKVKDIDYYRIDLGTSSKEDLKNISVGNLVVFDRDINLEFGANKFYGNALDDKVGVYVTCVLMKLLKQNIDVWGDKYTLIGLSGVQEESGLRGLGIASGNINPDISIDFDVTFAKDGGFVDSTKYGDIKLGSGAVIEYGQDKSRRIAKILKDVCTENKVPYQVAVSRCGGTNTDVIQLGSRDCETMLISFPNCNMHSPNEVCDWRDVNSAIDMIFYSISEGKL